MHLTKKIRYDKLIDGTFSFGQTKGACFRASELRTSFLGKFLFFYGSLRDAHRPQYLKYVVSKLLVGTWRKRPYTDTPKTKKRKECFQVYYRLLTSVKINF